LSCDSVESAAGPAVAQVGIAAVVGTVVAVGTAVAVETAVVVCWWQPHGSVRQPTRPASVAEVAAIQEPVDDLVEAAADEAGSCLVVGAAAAVGAESWLVVALGVAAGT